MFRLSIRLSFLLCSVLSLMLCMPMAAKKHTVPAQKTPLKLKFRESGEFRIVQFTDFHYHIGKLQGEAALRNIDSTLKHVDCDLVVVTGDIIYSTPGDSTLRRVLDRIERWGKPFVITFGNHDVEYSKLPLATLYDIVRSYPHNVQPNRTDSLYPDLQLPIYSSCGDSIAALAYVFYSGDYSPNKKEWGTYAWLTHEQVCNYRRMSAEMTKSHGGKPYPAVAFFHIALPEYNIPYLTMSAPIVGNRQDEVGSPKVNSGMFLAFREMGDVMGVFVGHDHNNDFVTTHQDIALCYGRFSGGNTTYNHLKRGARVITLKEGERRFSTYVRLQYGEEENHITYPDVFIRDDVRKRPVSAD